MANHDESNEQAFINRDYLKPVRQAADDFAWRLSAGDISRDEARDCLIEFAGAILDAVRVESAG